MERGQLAWLRNEKSRPANPKAHRTPPDDLRRPTRSVRLCGRSGYSHRRVSKRPPTSSGRVWRGLRISGSGPRRFSTPAARGRPPRWRRRANLRSPRGYHDPRALARLGRGAFLHLRGCGDSAPGSREERMEPAARGRSNPADQSSRDRPDRRPAREAARAVRRLPVEADRPTDTGRVQVPRGAWGASESKAREVAASRDRLLTAHSAEEKFRVAASRRTLLWHVGTRSQATASRAADGAFVPRGCNRRQWSSVSTAPPKAARQRLSAASEERIGDRESGVALELVVGVEEHERAAGQRHVFHEVRHLVRLHLLVRLQPEPVHEERHRQTEGDEKQRSEVGPDPENHGE